MNVFSSYVSNTAQLHRDVVMMLDLPESMEVFLQITEVIFQT